MHRPPKILILEKQMIIAADVSLQLSKLGYEVIGIHNRLEEAMKIVENNRPDIVLMNIGTQGRVEGIRTARIISKTLRVPVVFLSAHTGREILNRAITAQPYAFITKPFETKDLQRGIETVLSRMAMENLRTKKQSALLSI